MTNSKRRRRGPIDRPLKVMTERDYLDCMATDPGECVVYTDPGCDDDLHRLEVMGAAIAYQQGARWSGPTPMDCGCTLTLRKVSDLFPRPA